MQLATAGIWLQQAENSGGLTTRMVGRQEQHLKSAHQTAVHLAHHRVPEHQDVHPRVGVPTAALRPPLQPRQDLRAVVLFKAACGAAVWLEVQPPWLRCCRLVQEGAWSTSSRNTVDRQPYDMSSGCLTGSVHVMQNEHPSGAGMPEDSASHRTVHLCVRRSLD